MLGTALQFGGVRGDDRFYIPVKARKNQNQRKPVQREKGGETESADSISERKLIASENGNPNESSYLLSKPTSCSSVEPATNIDRFLESTTPLVPAQYLAKVDLIFSIMHLFLYAIMQLSYLLNDGFYFAELGEYNNLHIVYV